MSAGSFRRDNESGFVSKESNVNSYIARVVYIVIFVGKVESVRQISEIWSGTVG